jgi:hypothetical protein
MTRFSNYTHDDDDVDDNPNRILRNGERLSVSMMMRDSDRPRFIKDGDTRHDTQPARMTIVDELGRSDPMHLRQPGGRRLSYDRRSVEHALLETRRAMRDEAYASEKADVSNAWKQGRDRDIPLSTDSASITDARERAHADYENYISNAWKAGR